MDYVKDQALHIATEAIKKEAWYFKFHKTVTLPATKVNATLVADVLEQMPIFANYIYCFPDALCKCLSKAGGIAAF